MCATYNRTGGIRHLFAAYELGEDKLYGHIKPRKTRARFLEFCRCLRFFYPPGVRIEIICDNFSPHRARLRRDLAQREGPHRSRVVLRAAAYFAARGIGAIEAVIIDNAYAYRHSAAFRDAVAALGARQKFIRPLSLAKRQGRAIQPHPHRRMGLRAGLHQQTTSAALPCNPG
jgi:hypothetical protein